MSEKVQEVTVLVSRTLRPDMHADAQRWQRGVNDVLEEFPGFQGTEAFPPVEGVQDHWVVVYRFDTLENFQAWRHSDQRTRLLNEGDHLFSGPVTEQVLAGGQPPVQPVTVVVSNRVKPEYADEFERTQQQMIDAEHQFPGFMGSELYRPVPGVQDEWIVVFRFDSDAHMNDWLESDERQRILKESEPYLEDYEVRKVASSFGSWFSFSDNGESATMPPNWKQAMVVLVALYPLVMVLTLWFANQLIIHLDFPLWLAIFFSNVLSVIGLTWIIMPPLNRWLVPWLIPEGGDSARINRQFILIMLAGYAASLVIFGILAATTGRGA